MLVFKCLLLIMNCRQMFVVVYAETTQFTTYKMHVSPLSCPLAKISQYPCSNKKYSILYKELLCIFEITDLHL